MGAGPGLVDGFARMCCWRCDDVFGNAQYIPNAITVGAKESIAADKSLVNYGFYIGATPDNVADLAAATNIPGIRIFIGSSTGDLLVDGQAALERIFAETTLPICAHCEDEATVRANSE